MKAPAYPHDPIQSVGSLCRALAIAEPLLCSIAERVPKLYIGPTPKPKKSGNGFRDVYDTRPPLKPLLKRINKVFFERVVFPDYLHGSIRGCDFISNARVHEGSVTVITEDIKGFFDHITEEHAYAIWRRFFGFGEAPSELLTKLVTNGGRVYQGVSHQLVPGQSGLLGHRAAHGRSAGRSWPALQPIRRRRHHVASGSNRH